METIWYGLLGLFFATYLVLGGYDYGVGLLQAGTASPAQRRANLTAVGPFFLGNEVWLVAAVGILFGAFPMLEGELLSGLYPAVVLALAGVVTVTAAVQLRSRPAAERARAGWDRLIVAGSAVAAFGWGAVLAGLLQGVPLHRDGHVAGIGHVFTPFVAACGLGLVALVAVHGAAFLALRLPAAREPAGAAASGLRSEATSVSEGAGAAASGLRSAATKEDVANSAARRSEPARTDGASWAIRAGRRLIPAAIVAVLTATAVGLLSGQVRQAVQQPLAAVLMPAVLVGMLLLAYRALTRRRPGLAFAATSVALAAPALLAAVAIWPYALVSSVDPTASLAVTEAAASGPTLRLLSWLAVPLLPALLGFQLMCWWAFRGRIDGRAPVYW
jgi:cytochrome bd ubiquinol oxidase subunit II